MDPHLLRLTMVETAAPTRARVREKGERDEAIVDPRDGGPDGDVHPRVDRHGAGGASVSHADRHRSEMRLTTWNANAGEAAVAACISPTGNPLHESQMYAMVHVAIHDALNAIDRRSRPYAFDGHADARASPDAAVAAAARDVLVTLIGQLPEPPVPQACRDAGDRERGSRLHGRTRRDPGRAGRDARVSRWEQAAAAAILALRADDGSDTPLLDFDYPQGTEPGEYRFTSRPPVRVRTGLGRRDTVRAEVQLPVPVRTALCRDREEVHRVTSTR